VAGTARLRWSQVDAAMRRGDPLPRARTTTIVTVGVVLAGVLALVLVAVV